MTPRRDIGTDDPRVRVRPGRGSRPRTKRRPRHADAVPGMVTRIDRGHYRIRLADPALTEDGDGDITAMKARELGRGRVVVGDRVAVVGETPPAASEAGTPAGTCVRLTTATEAELQTLPGIGPALATRIISYRATHPRLSSVEELDDVPGIGPSLIEKIRPGVC